MTPDWQGALAITWLLCGVLSGTVASGKGRGWWRWFFLGSLVGPLGLVASLVVSPLSSSSYPKKTGDSYVSSGRDLARELGRDAAFAIYLFRGGHRPSRKGAKVHRSGVETTKGRRQGVGPCPPASS